VSISEDWLREPVAFVVGTTTQYLHIIIVSNPDRLLIPHDRLQRVWATENTYDFYYYSEPIVPGAEGTFWNFLGIFFEMKDSEAEVKKKISHTCERPVFNLF